MNIDNTQKPNDEILHIFKLVDNFAETKDVEVLEIPVELSKKQRSIIHDYIQQKGLFSESVQLKTSSNKKIIIHRSQVQMLQKEFSETIEGIDFFSQFSQIPIPHFPEFVDYYIKLFDPFYDSITSWDLFKEESKILVLKKEASDTSKKIQEYIKQSNEYEQFINKKLDQTIKTKPLDIKLKGDVYNISNVGKYYLSLDIRQANFTMLSNLCPNLFVPTNSETSNISLSWYSFVRKFTNSEFIARSKYFRELVFGQLGICGKLTTYQEMYMDKVHQKLMQFVTSNNYDMKPKIKCGDEIVYEIQDYNKLIDNMETLKTVIDPYSKLHFRVFHFEQIEQTNYFVKTFLYNDNKILDNSSFKNRIEFKKVEKCFISQIIKWFLKEKIEKKDLLFINNGIMAQYLVTLFGDSFI
jgi:hypothetical protein